MNILQLVDEPYDSGIVHYALTLSKGLHDRGHSVCVGGLPGAFPLREARYLELDALPVRGFPSGLFDLRRIIRNKGIQIINAHTGSAHSLAAAAGKLSRLPVKIVRTRGDSRPVRINSAGKFLWRRTAGLISPTEILLREFAAAWPRSGVTAQAIPPGLPLPTMNGPVPEPAAPPLRVGILGRLDPVKGHAIFLEAAALAARKFPEARFLAAGREENVKIGVLESRARDLGIADRVEFLGHVPEAGEFIRGCHVGVIASLGSEAISRAAIEWMAAGRPLIATRVGSLPEIVSPEKTGFLIPPGDAGAMAEHLIQLLSNPALRMQMGREAFEQFRIRFSFKRFIDETEKFYERALLHLPS